jgi:hypothetical protein
VRAVSKRTERDGLGDALALGRHLKTLSQMRTANSALLGPYGTPAAPTPRPVPASPCLLHSSSPDSSESPSSLICAVLRASRQRSFCYLPFRRLVQTGATTCLQAKAARAAVITGASSAADSGAPARRAVRSSATPIAGAVPVARTVGTEGRASSAVDAHDADNKTMPSASTVTHSSLTLNGLFVARSCPLVQMSTKTAALSSLAASLKAEIERICYRAAHLSNGTCLPAPPRFGLSG